MKKGKPVLQNKTSATKPDKPQKEVVSTAAGKVTRNVKKVKKSKGLARLWRESVGELRKVSWPTPREAWKLTRVVLVVMFLMSAFLGLMDFVFSKMITLLLA